MMRRFSMVALRETVRHITWGLETVGPQCVRKRAARRMRSSAAEADMDEFRAGIHNDRGFGSDFRRSWAGSVRAVRGVSASTGDA